MFVHAAAPSSVPDDAPGRTRKAPSRSGFGRITLSVCAAAITVASGLAGQPVAAADGGCIPGDIAGQVARLTRPSDNVCVPGHIADEVQQENAAAAAGQNYVPGGGAYGPQTCVAGLVWREGYEGDAVCVTPLRRTETWQENANAGVGATGGLAPKVPLSGGAGSHTVTFQVLGAGDVYSIIPDPGTSQYPTGVHPGVPTPWSQTVQVTGAKYLALNYTDKDGTHDCSIEVDGQPVALAEHQPGRCAYQLN